MQLLDLAMPLDIPAPPPPRLGLLTALRARAASALRRLVRPTERRVTVLLVTRPSVTLSELREAATGVPDGPARHMGTGRFVSRRAAETLTATEAAWFRPAARGVAS